MDIDSPDFNVKAFVDRCIQHGNLSAVVREAQSLKKDVKKIDHDLRQLVFANYNKFIYATDVMKDLCENLESIERELERLSPGMEKVQKINAGLKEACVDRAEELKEMASVHVTLAQAEKLQNLPELLDELWEAGEMRQVLCECRAFEFFMESLGLNLQGGEGGGATSAANAAAHSQTILGSLMSPGLLRVTAKAVRDHEARARKEVVRRFKQSCEGGFVDCLSSPSGKGEQETGGRGATSRSQIKLPPAGPSQKSVGAVSSSSASSSGPMRVLQSQSQRHSLSLSSVSAMASALLEKEREKERETRKAVSGARVVSTKADAEATEDARAVAMRVQKKSLEAARLMGVAAMAGKPEEGAGEMMWMCPFLAHAVRHACAVLFCSAVRLGSARLRDRERERGRERTTEGEGGDPAEGVLGKGQASMSMEAPERERDGTTCLDPSPIPVGAAASPDASVLLPLPQVSNPMLQGDWGRRVVTSGQISLVWLEYLVGCGIPFFRRLCDEMTNCLQTLRERELEEEIERERLEEEGGMEAAASVGNRQVISKERSRLSNLLSGLRAEFCNNLAQCAAVMCARTPGGSAPNFPSVWLCALGELQRSVLVLSPPFSPAEMGLERAKISAWLVDSALKHATLEAETGVMAALRELERICGEAVRQEIRQSGAGLSLSEGGSRSATATSASASASVGLLGVPGEAAEREREKETGGNSGKSSVVRPSLSPTQRLSHLLSIQRGVTSTESGVDLQRTLESPWKLVRKELQIGARKSLQGAASLLPFVPQNPAATLCGSDSFLEGEEGEAEGEEGRGEKEQKVPEGRAELALRAAKLALQPMERAIETALIVSNNLESGKAEENQHGGRQTQKVEATEGAAAWWFSRAETMSGSFPCPMSIVERDEREGAAAARRWCMELLKEEGKENQGHKFVSGEGGRVADGCMDRGSDLASLQMERVSIELIALCGWIATKGVDAVSREIRNILPQGLLDIASEDRPEEGECLEEVQERVRNKAETAAVRLTNLVAVSRAHGATAAVLHTSVKSPVEGAEENEGCGGTRLFSGWAEACERAAGCLLSVEQLLLSSLFPSVVRKVLDNRGGIEDSPVGGKEGGPLTAGKGGRARAVPSGTSASSAAPTEGVSDSDSDEDAEGPSGLLRESRKGIGEGGQSHPIVLNAQERGEIWRRVKSRGGVGGVGRGRGGSPSPLHQRGTEVWGSAGGNGRWGKGDGYASREADEDEDDTAAFVQSLAAAVGSGIGDAGIHSVSVEGPGRGGAGARLVSGADSLGPSSPSAFEKEVGRLVGRKAAVWALCGGEGGGAKESEEDPRVEEERKGARGSIFRCPDEKRRHRKGGEAGGRDRRGVVRFERGLSFLVGKALRVCWAAVLRGASEAVLGAGALLSSHRGEGRLGGEVAGLQNVQFGCALLSDVIRRSGWTTSEERTALLAMGEESLLTAEELTGRVPTGLSPEIQRAQVDHVHSAMHRLGLSI
uniref:Uncharacterized protein n=1 Tax=Chromera velia CCMP2878 TaxID=1169474 RepID=A0A0G4H6L2_9ALVE|eukprot:Cvel_24852.t1-p1 / transcript=Cvel_24852.t1 / gene=Cvel_24852 / organism=Chromera_velia_CCMP2878 / gene_product=Vacuolar protein sorting-associated protein 51, putative / transcript_product=Vacuolar protein sorting-associated protein 51, putative / location=Cvel_scaffold2743:1862-10050(+) / protein_length=1478 / sequence_SO=supercontig / SO=protein_coding / is_pseudo=false